MKLFAVLALAATAPAYAGRHLTDVAACQQSVAQIAALNEQINNTQQQAAQCAAGGAIEPYNPAWAPWPTHAWPDASTNTCDQMQTHATYIQKSNQQQIQQIQANMNMQGC